jgi:hypothetical protein
VIGVQAAKVKRLPTKWTDADRQAGRDQEARREIARLEILAEKALEYGGYAQALSRMLQLDRASLLTSVCASNP